jgi:hypothetical protein
MILTGWERSAQDRQGFWWQQERDAACGAGSTANEAETFQSEDHGMDRGSGDLEVVLEVALRGRPAIDLGVGVQEGQILTLRGGKSRRLVG